jgi:cytidylate kinase
LKKSFTIAIDGFSSTGKSTLAKQLAKELQYTYVDSGAMYRAVALYGLRNSCIAGKEVDRQCLIDALRDIEIQFEFDIEGEGNSKIFLNGENVENQIRTMEVNQVVSLVSSISEVRRVLVAIQQGMGQNGGVVMDGRDIGTVVFPNAELKIYMTADADIRAIRRYDELKRKGFNVPLDEIKNNLLMRDKQDQERLDSPLLKAEDALELDNSKLTAEEQLNWILEKVNQIREKA